MIVLHAEALIDAPAEICFDLARSVDVHAASATPIHGKAVGGKCAGLASAGDETTWSAQFFRLRFRLTTRIVDYERPHYFTDVMCRGLFRHFGHVYTFEPLGPHRTRLMDEFSFESPFGPLGLVFDRMVLCSPMQSVADARIRFLKRVAESGEWRQYPEMAHHAASGAGT